MKLVSITNPELRRNLWLELTLHRLLAAPLVIALCAALILAASEKDSLEILTGAAGTGFVATVLLWGTQLAGAGKIGPMPANWPTTARPFSTGSRTRRSPSR